MSKKWGDVPLDERKVVLEAVAKAINDAGESDTVAIHSLDQFVGNLTAGEMAKECHLMVKGSFTADKKEKIPPLTAAITQAAGDVAVKFEISATIAQGDPMGVIENQTPMEGEEKVNITHTEGEVILLDFWATWCPPCQQPMAHNQDMVARNKEKWGGKVRIIGLSIDQDQTKLQDHVKAKGWTDVEHYWSRNGASTADKDYGVQGVPHCLLVDTHGVIVFVGHPANRKFEEDFDALLKGEKISGAGTARAGGDDGGEDKAEITDAKYESLTTKFWDGLKEITANEEVKQNVAKLQRAFFVLVVDAKVDPKTMKMVGGMTCHTQLFGNPEAAAAIQKYTSPISEMEGWESRVTIR